MADRFECDKCHTMFPDFSSKAARLTLEELSTWTDHPERAAYKHESILCPGCFEQIRTAIHKPHRPPGQVELSKRVSAGRHPAENCEECGAPILEDLSCTPGCGGMKGLTEAKRVTAGLDMGTALGLLMRAHERLKEMGGQLDLRLEIGRFVERMKGTACSRSSCSPWMELPKPEARSPKPEAVSRSE